MSKTANHHDEETRIQIRGCLSEMESLLAACHQDWRRRPHEDMALPSAMKLLQRSSDPDIVKEAIARWDVLKRCNSLVEVDRGFQSATEAEHKKAARHQFADNETMGDISDAKDHHVRGKLYHAHLNTLKVQSRVQVDVVDGGYEWIQVRLLQPRRLVEQMTQSGWSWDTYKRGDVVPFDEWEDIALTKRLKQLVAAAKRNLHDFRRPRIRLVLPLIVRQDHPDYDILFEQYTNIDPDVQVTIEDRDSLFLRSPLPANFIANLLGDPLADLTATVTLEHTVLIDLISDLTHCRLEPQPWQVLTTRSQIEEENSHEGGWMAKWLYSSLPGRRLVITKAGAKHLYQILETVGTETEKERARLLVPHPGEQRAITDEEARSRFQALSIHRLPDNFQIPVDVQTDADRLNDEKIAAEVEAARISNDNTLQQPSSILQDNHRATVLSAWRQGHTIVTSNREYKNLVRKWIKSTGCSPEMIRDLRIHTLQVARYMLSSHATPRPSDLAKATGTS
ncbi:hypothetical protein CC79DRAFT_1373613 [Sarocladium strictum]